MSKGIIELNDACISLGLDGNVVAQSSGYAVLDQQNLILGTPAQQKFKLLPRWTNNRFWHHLNTDGLSNATAAIRHHADLAFAHLEQLKQELDCEHIVLAVPAHYDKSQLGLLLGMCKEAGLPVRAVVDLALVSIANQSSHPDALYLDAGLHNISLTTLRTDGALRQTGHYSLLDTGLSTYWDRWASLIAEQFIQSSRFDPMHEAASEQQLFNGLADFIANIGNQRALTYELDLGSVKHSTAISKDQVVNVTANAYPTIVQGVRQHAPRSESFTLFVSPRLKHFPELSASLDLIPGANITYLDDTQVAENSAALWDSLVTQDGSIPHVRTLSVATPTPTLAAKTPQATHLLVGQKLFHLREPRAFSGFGSNDGTSHVSDKTIAIITAANTNLGASSTSLQIIKNSVIKNGEALSKGTFELKIGDVLDIDGDQATVIAEQ